MTGDGLVGVAAVMVLVCCGGFGTAVAVAALGAWEFFGAVEAWGCLSEPARAFVDAGRRGHWEFVADIIGRYLCD